MHLIGLTGAHGTGKTWVLNELAKPYLSPFCVVPEYPSMSRSAQDNLGVKLPDIKTAEFSDIMKFQNEILRLVIERDEELRERYRVDYSLRGASAKSVIVDRTPWDLLVYTLLWTKRFETDVACALVIEDYQERCLAHLYKFYNTVFLFPIVKEFGFVAEAQRADEDSRLPFQRVLQLYYTEVSSNVPVRWISRLDVRDRAREVLGFL